MSRHILPPKAGHPDVICAAVGWEPGELPTPEAAIAVITPYAEIPPRLAEQLLADMTATIGEKDGRHQAEVKRRLFGSIH